jgi:hypothetical protein
MSMGLVHAISGYTSSHRLVDSFRHITFVSGSGKSFRRAGLTLSLQFGNYLEL